MMDWTRYEVNGVPCYRCEKGHYYHISNMDRCPYCNPPWTVLDIKPEERRNKLK